MTETYRCRQCGDEYGKLPGNVEIESTPEGYHVTRNGFPIGEPAMGVKYFAKWTDALEYAHAQVYPDHVARQRPEQTGPYVVEVCADRSGEFVANGLRFETIETAKAYGHDLAIRWTAVRDWRVIEACDFSVRVRYWPAKGIDDGEA